MNKELNEKTKFFVGGLAAVAFGAIVAMLGYSLFGAISVIVGTIVLGVSFTKEGNLDLFPTFTNKAEYLSAAVLLGVLSIFAALTKKIRVASICFILGVVLLVVGITKEGKIDFFKKAVKDLHGVVGEGNYNYSGSAPAGVKQDAFRMRNVGTVPPDTSSVDYTFVPGPEEQGFWTFQRPSPDSAPYDLNVHIQLFNTMQDALQIESLKECLKVINNTKDTLPLQVRGTMRFMIFAYMGDIMAKILEIIDAGDIDNRGKTGFFAFFNFMSYSDGRDVGDLPFRPVSESKLEVSAKMKSRVKFERTIGSYKNVPKLNTLFDLLELEETLDLKQMEQVIDGWLLMFSGDAFEDPGRREATKTGFKNKTIPSKVKNKCSPTVYDYIAMVRHNGEYLDDTALTMTDIV